MGISSTITDQGVEEEASLEMAKKIEKAEGVIRLFGAIFWVAQFRPATCALSFN
jgi:hypothetical protein